MENDEYVKARYAAEKELDRLLTRETELILELAKVQQRIGVVRETIANLVRLERPAAFLSSMIEDGQLDPVRMAELGIGGWGSFTSLGLTDAIREVLKTSGTDYLSPTDVRDKLQKSGYDASKQANVLASIHTILKRLEASGEAEPKDIGDKRIYRFNRNPARSIARNPTKGIGRIRGGE